MTTAPTLKAKAKEPSIYEELPIPARTAFGGAGNSELANKLSGCPVGKSFLEAVTVPDTIKDDGERAKVFKEEARKLSNRISGAIRRYRKSNPDTDFAIRTVNDDKMGHGVRVWRVEQEAKPAA